MKRPKITYEPIMGALTVGKMIVDVEIFAAIFAAPARVLWRFEVVDARVTATAYDEREVIFLDKEAPSVE